MSLSKDFKLLLRSKSWSFVQDSKAAASTQLKYYQWQGFKVNYRPGTSDIGLIYEVLLRPGRRVKSNALIQYKKHLEYWVPPEISPMVIFDIGANIGITSIFYSSFFPEAKIYSFEPVKSNFEVLSANTKDVSNIEVFNFGLGSKNEEIEIYSTLDETNKGGFSLYSDSDDINQNSSERIKIRNLDDVLKELSVTSIDLIKIDTEGAEYDILRSIDQKILSKVKWIIGELHSIDDFKLLDYLSEWFLIDIEKGLKNKLSLFNACNRTIANEINWK